MVVALKRVIKRAETRYLNVRMRHMKKRDICRRLLSGPVILMLLALAGGLVLTSCSTTPSQSTGNAGFKFWVLRYKPPVDATAWVPDAALSADPEGAALNIEVAMQQGNIEQWLSNWDAGERPNLTPAQSAALLQQWQSLRGRHVSILGRVVAEADVIVELSVDGLQGGEGKIQIPLKRENDRWWLTAMDPASEYLHWENSPNKLVDYIDPAAFQQHLKVIEGSKPKAKVEIAPPKKSTPLAGL
jgi:hypothetical protein